MSKEIDLLTGKVRDIPDPVIVATVPNAVNSLQFRKALRSLNRMTAFRTYLDTLTEEELEEWQFSTLIKIDSPMVVNMTNNLGLTNKQLQNLFAAASKIEI